MNTDSSAAHTACKEFSNFCGLLSGDNYNQRLFLCCHRVLLGFCTHCGEAGRIACQLRSSKNVAIAVALKHKLRVFRDVSDDAAR